MPSWRPRPRFTSWRTDTNNRLVLLEIPEKVQIDTSDGKLQSPPSLSTLDKPGHPPRTAPALSLLPPEIHYTILHHLAPVDRVCLALTCRRLCASVLSSPRLTPQTWLRFMIPSDPPNRYWNPNAHYLTVPPDHYQLSQRLAHGWFDKKQWRYCWKCHKILPRSAEWWWTSRDRTGEKRIQGRKNLRWSHKTGVEKGEWTSWNRRKRLRWIIDVWCKAGWEDSSVVGCDSCRENLLNEDVERIQAELTEPKKTVVVEMDNGEFDVTSFIGNRHPVECPTCLERELTFRWKPQKRVVVRRFLWSTGNCLWDWTIGIVWCVGSAWVSLFVIVWELLVWAAVGIQLCFHHHIPRLWQGRSFHHASWYH